MNRSHQATRRPLAIWLLLPAITGCCCLPNYWTDSGGSGSGKSPFQSTAPKPTIRLSQQFNEYQWQASETLIISAEDAAVSLINDTIHVSPDGRHYAFAKKVEGGAAWVFDGKPQATMATTGQLAFTPDGQHYLAAGSRGCSVAFSVTGEKYSPSSSRFHHRPVRPRSSGVVNQYL